MPQGNNLSARLMSQTTSSVYGSKEDETEDKNLDPDAEKMNDESEMLESVVTKSNPGTNSQ